MQWVRVRHEEVAAFAAGAEAHLTGGLAVCAGSCGPGNLHLINGLFDCHRSRVPVLAIAAQIPSAEIGSNYFQETHPQSLFRECSHYCELVSSPEQMPRVLQTAIREATARRGVVVVVIPGDVALQAAAEAPIRRRSTSFRGRRPSLRRLPTSTPLPIFSTAPAASPCCAAPAAPGRTTGCWRWRKSSRRRSSTACAARNMSRGKNPFDVGMTGLIGFSSGYFAMGDCDALLMLGTDFPYRQFYPQEGARIAQIDIRPENARPAGGDRARPGRRRRPDDRRLAPADRGEGRPQASRPRPSPLCQGPPLARRAR